MLSVADQIASGKLVCPVTHEPLAARNDSLTTDGGRNYPLTDGVPILLESDAQREYRGEQDAAMYEQYEKNARRGSLLSVINRFLAKDFRSAAATAAFEAVVTNQPERALCVSIGGGPARVHPNAVNLNIDRFDNVDVVGDAYALPYADGAVDAIHCNAVLEHLEFPARAVGEMHRVLRPGGQVFCQTPFLQAFHAFPSHFQNFTLEGHNRLFVRGGFELRASGAAVGPTFAVSDLVSTYLRTYLPGLIGVAAQKLVQLVSMLFRPVDKLLFRTGKADRVASTVFVQAIKRQTQERVQSGTHRA